MTVMTESFTDTKLESLTEAGSRGAEPIATRGKARGLEWCGEG